MSHHQQAVSHGPQLTLARLMLLGAAFATGGAGVVHLDAAGDHGEHAFVAAFFVTAGLAQLALAVALGQRTPHRLAVPAALAVNIGLLVTWALSRTVGLDALPVLGSVPGVVGTEAVGTKDLVTAGLELMALMLVGLASAAPAAAGAALLLPTAARASLAGLLALALSLTVPGVLASHDASHHDAHGHGDPAAAHPHEGGEHPADHPHGGDDGHQAHGGHDGVDHADHGDDVGTHDDHDSAGGHVHSPVSHGDHNTGSHGEHGSGGHGGHGDGGNHGDHGGGGNHGDHGDGGDHGDHTDHDVATEPDPLAGPGRITTMRVGPIPLLPSVDAVKMPHTSPFIPMVGPGKLNVLPLMGIKPPCTDCFILGAQPDLVYADGSSANIDTGPMLHHVVVADPTRVDPVCGRSGPGLIGERIFAAGNERTGLAMPEGFGLPIRADSFNGAIELMNMSNQLRNVFFEMTVRWVPLSTPDIKPLRALWFDIDSCGDSEVPIGTGVTDISDDWTSNVTGRIVAAGGHVHDGGQWVSVRNTSNGETVCNSVADYGNDPAAMGTVDTMSTCSHDRLAGVRAGDTMRITAHYNTTVKDPGAMGIMMAFLYETEDVDGGTPSPYPSKPPPDTGPGGGHHH